VGWQLEFVREGSAKAPAEPQFTEMSSPPLDSFMEMTGESAQYAARTRLRRSDIKPDLQKVRQARAAERSAAANR